MRNAECGMRHAASRNPDHASRITRHAFTLVEILVTVGLLSFIILGLFAVFNQVQRAFRNSMNEVDRLEAGRAVTELLPREIEQTTPCGFNATTFSAQIIPNSTPLWQYLPGTVSPQIQRTNFLEDCFILQRQNQTWIGIGYCVRTNDANGRLWLPESGPGQLGVGSLYRYTATLPVLYYNINRANDPNNGTVLDPRQLYLAFRNACAPGTPASLAISNRICDGVIHFYLQASATNGFPIFSDGSHTNAYFRTNALAGLPYSSVHPAQTTSDSSYSGYPGNLTGVYFYSNAVPAFVELQLGILEQHAVERYNSMGDPTSRLNYLQRIETASRVNLFRQRIPIRNVNPLAYQ